MVCVIIKQIKMFKKHLISEIRYIYTVVMLLRKFITPGSFTVSSDFVTLLQAKYGCNNELVLLH
jgi:hypothetical protein